jgi:hypothetical protein
MFSYAPGGALHEKSRKLFTEGHKGRETAHHSVGAYETRSLMSPYPKYWSRYNRANAYNYDYATGMPGLWLEDAACQSGVAPICDRSKEILGTSDTGIARVRRMLLDNAKKLAQGAAAPATAAPPAAYRVRAVSITIPAGGNWAELGRDFMRAELGKGFGYTP